MTKRLGNLYVNHNIVNCVVESNIGWKIGIIHNKIMYSECPKTKLKFVLRERMKNIVGGNVEFFFEIVADFTA